MARWLRSLLFGCHCGHETKEGGKIAKDPVCGMEVDEKKAAAKAEHKGKTYYFCAPGCQKAFAENPEKYLKEEPEMKHLGH